MNEASYRLWRQAAGRGSFAEVTVSGSAVGMSASLTRAPRAWVSAAERGVQSAIAAIGDAPARISLWKLVFTYADTSEDAVHAAAFMATARYLKKDGEFELDRREGKWRVVSARGRSSARG